MINNVTLVGRVVRDPELNRPSKDFAVSNFTIAVDNYGDEQNPTSFISCVAYNNQAEFLTNYARKGNLIGLVGFIKTRTYENKDGATVYVTEVIAKNIQLLTTKAENERKAQDDTQPWDERPQAPAPAKTTKKYAYKK